MRPNPTPSLALLFDLDGTLADSIALLLAAFHHTFSAHRPDAIPSDAEWIAGIGTPLITQMRHFVPDEHEAQQMIAQLSRVPAHASRRDAAASSKASATRSRF